MKFQVVILVTLYLFCLSCSNSGISEEEYYKFLNTPKNGLVQEKFVNGFTLKMKYLPPCLLAYRETSSISDEKVRQHAYDSLIETYKKGHTFLFSIEDEELKPGQDIIQYGIYDEVEFKQRFRDLHFNIDEHIWVQLSSKKLKPQLSVLESTFELFGPKTFYLVFEEISENDEQESADEIDIVFNDTFFDTGISHFVFKNNDLNNLPKLNF